MIKAETRVRVGLTGLSPIMFDRYPGNNQTELPPERKMYFLPDGKTLMLPARNINSFLSATNTVSAPRRLYDARKYKDVCFAFMSFVAIEPFEIPFTRDSEPIQFAGFGKNGIRLDRSVARLAKGVPNPKERPFIELPWELNFTLNVFPNEEFGMDQLYDIFRRGGLTVGLGTWRGVYGKFRVQTWEATENSG